MADNIFKTGKLPQYDNDQSNIFRIKTKMKYDENQYHH